MRIYIAGPYSNGDKLKNTEAMIAVADKIAALGHTPYIPLFTHYWDQLFEHDYDFWMMYDFQWLRLCDAIFRMPGDSNGADMEIEVGGNIGLKIFWRFEDIPDWGQGKLAKNVHVENIK